MSDPSETTDDAKLRTALESALDPSSWPDDWESDEACELFVRTLVAAATRDLSSEHEAVLEEFQSAYLRNTSHRDQEQALQRLERAVLESGDPLAYRAFDPFLTTTEYVQLEVMQLAVRLQALTGPEPGPDGRPMGASHGVAVLRQVEEMGLPEQAGAIGQALLELGDERFTACALDAWRSLTVSGMEAMALARTTPPTAPLVEFYLDRLLERHPTSVQHELAMAFLAVTLEASVHGVVRIHWPTRPEDEDDGPEIVQRWTLPEFTEVLRPRLARLRTSRVFRKEVVLGRALDIWAGRA